MNEPGFEIDYDFCYDIAIPTVSTAIATRRSERYNLREVVSRKDGDELVEDTAHSLDLSVFGDRYKVNSGISLLIGSARNREVYLEHYQSAFLSQIALCARFHRCDSIRKWRDAVFEQIHAYSFDADRPIVLNISAFPGQNQDLKRAFLIEKELRAQLQKKWRTVSRKLSPAIDPFEFHPYVVELTLLGTPDGDGELGFTSIVETSSALPSVYPLGTPMLVEDRQPPSRAYLKLLEAEKHLWRRIGSNDRVIDLGGAPGGWTSIAAMRGANVLAVDRAQLAPKWMAHPNVQFIRADALEYDPTSPVDWLLCDIICEPRRSVELLSRWLERDYCRRWVITLKFRGEPDRASIRDAIELNRTYSSRSFVRRLSVNKNELTVCGERAQ